MPMISINKPLVVIGVIAGLITVLVVIMFLNSPEMRTVQMENGIVSAVGIPRDLTLSPRSDDTRVGARHVGGPLMVADNSDDARSLWINVVLDQEVLLAFVSGSSDLQVVEKSVWIKGRQWQFEEWDQSIRVHTLVGDNAGVLVMARNMTHDEVVRIIEAVVFVDAHSE